MGVDLSATQFCFELFPSKPTFVFIADGESGGRKMYGVMGWQTQDMGSSQASSSPDK